MKSRFILAKAWVPVLTSAVSLIVGMSPRNASAGNTWDGGSVVDSNWGTAANWNPDGAPTYGTIVFSGTVRTSNINNGITAMNKVQWNNATGWHMSNSGGTVLSLFDSGGVQAKLENLGTGKVTITAPITFAANNGSPANPFGEINAVAGSIEFLSGTLTVNGSSVNGIKLFGGAGKNLQFASTVSAAGKWFGFTNTNGSTVEIALGGNVTTGDFYVMNGGTLFLNGGTLTTSAVRLGGDFGNTGNQNQTFGGTLALSQSAVGVNFSSTINTVSGNTSGTLAVNSLNTSGTNLLSGNLFLDSNLAVTQSSGGSLTISGSTLDLKGQTLSLRGTGGNINITGVLSNSTGSGQLVVGTNGTAGSGGTVTLSAANTYSGQTFVRNGTLALASGGTVANSTIRLGSSSGAGVDANVNLTSASGGQNISSTINPVSTSGGGTLMVNSQNTSGTNTLSGHLGLDRNLTITQSGGGILAITQARAGGVSTTTGTDLKGFTLNLSPASSGTINYSGDIYNSVNNGSVVTGGGGTVNLSGANTYSGTTVINTGTLQASSAGALGGTSNLTINTGGTLLLTNTGTTNRINNSATITMAGGTIAFSGNVTEGSSPGTGALTLTANSIIDFAGGNAVINFGDSSGATWTGGTTLSIYNWDGLPAGNGNDQLIFGIDNNALTAGQLSQVSFFSGNGSGFLGTATILNDGELVPIPEPSAIFTTLGLLGLIGYRERRQRRR